jgi:hypothetical protein
MGGGHTLIIGNGRWSAIGRGSRPGSICILSHRVFLRELRLNSLISNNEVGNAPEACTKGRTRFLFPLPRTASGQRPVFSRNTRLRCESSRRLRHSCGGVSGGRSPVFRFSLRRAGILLLTLHDVLASPRISCKERPTTTMTTPSTEAPATRLESAPRLASRPPA